MNNAVFDSLKQLPEAMCKGKSNVSFAHSYIATLTIHI